MVSIPKDCKCPELFKELARQNLSQKDFAEKIGASTGNVSDWANGKSAPSRKRWSVISRVLGKPANELMVIKKEPAGDGGLGTEWAEVESAYKNASPEARAAAKAAALAVLNSERKEG